MGYFVKGNEIAKISPKARSVSLSASPNYVQFESKEMECETDLPARPKGNYIQSRLFLSVSSILYHMESTDYSMRTNSVHGIAIVNLKERMSGKIFKFRIRFAGYSPHTGIEVNQENFPDDVVLDKDYHAHGLKSFVYQLNRIPEFADNYEVTEEAGIIILTARKSGTAYGVSEADNGGLLYASDWSINQATGMMESKSFIVIDDQVIIYSASTTIKIEETIIACKPFTAEFTMGNYWGYGFENVAELPSFVTKIPLNRDESLETLKEYLKKTNKRINPYTAYFEEDNGNIYRFINHTRFAIKDKLKGIERWFQGLDPVMKVSGAYETSDYTYELSDNPIQTAQNLKEALLRCPYVRDNFKVSSPINLDEYTGFVEQSSVVNLESLYAGKRFNFEIVLNKEMKDENDEEYAEYKKRFDSFVLIKLSDYDSVNPDTINEGAEACEIQIDMYADTGLFLGQDDRPDIDDLGSYVTTLSKAYFNQPVWFDLNSIQTKKYKPPFGAIDSESERQKSDAGVWFDAATYSDRRFVAKRVTSTMSESFYYSPVLYTLTGYERSLDQSDIGKYVYDASTTTSDKLVQPLTLQPDLLHVRGQIQYFNFVLKDKDHADNQSNLGLEYELLTQSEVLLDTIIDHQQPASQFSVVNTIALDIDRFADQYANLGIVRIRLCRDGERVSEPLTLNIQPSYLHRVHDFVFLNSLGGWSSFNFGYQDQLDFKATPTTFFRNQTPSSSRSSSIETIYTKAIEERFVVRTQPITLATADWLKEISSSIAVYECESRRYIIVDEMNVKYTTQDNFVRLEMKYHYSDSFNAQY